MKKMSQAKFILNHVQEKVASEKEQEKMVRIKRERVIFIRRLVALTILMVGLFSIVSFAKGLDIEEKFKTNHVESLENDIAQYEKVEVFIWEGKTAWDIQAELTPNKDVRDMLELVSHLNKIDNIGDIKAGQTLLFLKDI